MSDDVAKAIENYEAEQARLVASHESREVRALVQGMLAGAMMQQMNSGVIRIQDIELPQDANGNYLDHFVVVMGSGIRVRVDVDLDK